MILVQQKGNVMKVVVKLFYKDSCLASECVVSDLESAYARLEELILSGRVELDGLVSITEYHA